MKNVLLVFGGKSYEHDISVVTALQIFNRTKLDDYKLNLIYLTQDNRFYFYLKDSPILTDFKDSEVKNKRKFKELFFISGENGKLFIKTAFGLKHFLTSNLAIMACHGGDGENGKLVSRLEMFGIYSSAGSFDGLAVSMNKFLFKNTMKGIGVPVVNGFLISRNEFECESAHVREKIKKFGFPVILKINNGGSSIGVFIANNFNEFQNCLQNAFEFDEFVLVEKFLEGCREFNVAILGNLNSYDISEIDEPIKNHELLSFADKYLSSKSSKSMKFGNKSLASQKRNLPANVDNQLKRKIKTIASRVFETLNLSGVIRIDFLYDEKTKKVYVCEVNAIPGSLGFYFFSRGTVLLNSFVSKLINIAEKKQNSLTQVKSDFVTNIF
ncbi:MAG: ATP-grasp domain-containing protein [Clostridia bacterium]|nr:ATP-grasp domain-containing protein [Clostridia bacterium]